MTDLVEQMSSALDTREAKVRDYEARYIGDSPFILLTSSQRETLDNRLKSLRIPLEGLAVDLLNERLRISGWTVDGSEDLDLSTRWDDFGGPEIVEQVQRDALVCGQGYASVWADEDGEPVALPESARQCLVKRDPVTRRVVVGFKRWHEDNRGRGILYTPAEVKILQSASNVPDGGQIPSTGWVTVKALPNPLGLVPLVPVTNLGAVTQAHGRSELDALADICDAVRKVSLDALLTSHESGKPRRWTTGVEVETDEDGNGVDPWAGGTSTLQAEPPDAKIGQLDAAPLSGFDVLNTMLLKQFSALSGLSPQSVGIAMDALTSADSQRAAEASLVARAEARQRAFGRGWGLVGALLVAIRDGRDPRKVRCAPVWRDPATRSEAQAADAAVKLNAAGLLSREGTLTRIGMTGPEIAADSRRVAAEQAQRLALQ